MRTRLAIAAGVVAIVASIIGVAFIAAPSDDDTVPDGHVYVLGDNRAAAKDSRYWGPVPLDSILGSVDAG